MRKLLPNNKGDMDFILGAIILAVTLAVGIIIVWNVMGSFSPTELDDQVTSAVYNNASSDNIRPVENATNDLNANIETFYTVGPIVLIVVAAVGILSYILLLRRQ